MEIKKIKHLKKYVLEIYLSNKEKRIIDFESIVGEKSKKFEDFKNMYFFTKFNFEGNCIVWFDGALKIDVTKI